MVATTVKEQDLPIEMPDWFPTLHQSFKGMAASVKKRWEDIMFYRVRFKNVKRNDALHAFLTKRANPTFNLANQVYINSDYDVNVIYFDEYVNWLIRHVTSHKEEYLNDEFVSDVKPSLFSKKIDVFLTSIDKDEMVYDELVGDLYDYVSNNIVKRFHGQKAKFLFMINRDYGLYFDIVERDVKILTMVPINEVGIVVNKAEDDDYEDDNEPISDRELHDTLGIDYDEDEA